MASAVQTRLVRIDRSGDDQSIPIPKEFELQGEEATITRDARGRLIVETTQAERLASFIELLHRWEPLAEEDAIPKIEKLTVEPFDL